MSLDRRPVVRVTADTAGVDSDDWPMTMPVVQQLVREGLELPKGVTFLVGENGTGKSTLVEAIAVAYGLSPEGGTRYGRHSTRPTESALSSALVLRRGAVRDSWGFFLRAETMHGWYTFAEQHATDRDPRFHEMSHGESFLEVLRTRFDSPGFYCLDEPEAALSFSSTLGLMSRLHELANSGGQVLCATHSPVLASLPGATILETGVWGYRRTAWEDLELVQHWKDYLEEPGRYLRHVLE